jgi:ABC-type branched-subunit amino acid transport system substrate-binding protein
VRIQKSRSAAKAVAAFAGLSLLVSACGAGESNDSDSGGGGGSAAEVEGDTTGITESTIKIGTHMPLTGPAAPGYSTIPQGYEAYFEHVNANGGICGRQLEIVVRDDGYNPTNTVQVTNQLVLQDEVFAMLGGLGTPTHTAVLDFLNENQVPDLFVSSGSVLWKEAGDNPYTFGWQSNYTTEGKIMGQYIAENFPDAKVGLFGQADDFGRDGFAGAKQYLEDQIVAEQTYTPGNTDVAPQMTALQQAGADLVIGFNVPAYTALTQLTAQRLNYKPTWFYSNVGSNVALVGALLANFSKGAVQGAGALEGIYSNTYIPTSDKTDDPWVQAFSKIWDASGPNEEPFSDYRMYGMSQAYTLVTAIANICDNLNREALVAVVEEKGADFELPLLAPMEYSEDSHRGVTGVKVLQIQGGKTVDKTPVLVTDDGDGEITESDFERADPPENGIPEAS